jgi:hypothetical protein
MSSILGFTTCRILLVSEDRLSEALLRRASRGAFLQRGPKISKHRAGEPGTLLALLRCSGGVDGCAVWKIDQSVRNPREGRGIYDRPETFGWGP